MKKEPKPSEFELFYDELELERINFRMFWNMSNKETKEEIRQLIENRAEQDIKQQQEIIKRSHRHG